MTTEEQPSLSVLINQIDHTLAPPGPLDNASLHRVPIIRIYGASSTGVKACVHVHQVYPYFFVEYPGRMTPDNVNRYIAKLSVSLDHAIALSIKRNLHSPNSQFIRAILLVKGVHFYGFHSSYTPFLKILIADPAFVNRAVTILQSGTVMRTKFRVYESHLSYHLQFMCDFGLYGCGWINLGEVWQRGLEDQDPIIVEFDSCKISPYFRQSRMPLEVDVAAHQILNRHLLSARNVHHKLTIPALPMPFEPVVLSVRELWEDERRRRIAKGLSPTPVVPIELSKTSRGSGGDWVAEARWWDELRTKIQREKEDNPLMVESEGRWEKWVMTTFESVEALWEPQWRTWKPERSKPDELEGHVNPGAHEAEGAENPFAQATQAETWVSNDVDEAMLSSQDFDQMMDCEEQEWAKFADDEKNSDTDETFNEDDCLAEGPLFNYPEDRGHEMIEDENARARTIDQLTQSVSKPPPPRASYSSLAGSQSFSRPSGAVGFAYAHIPPSTSELLSTLEEFGLPSRTYRDPFYSKKVDVPDGPREYAGFLYHLRGGGGLDVLEGWQSSENCRVSVTKLEALSVRFSGWEIASSPPSVRQVRKWLDENPAECIRKARMRSQVIHFLILSGVEGRTQDNIFGMESIPAKRLESNTREGAHMSLLSMEVFAPSRGDRLPDANVDEIIAVFYALGDDSPHLGLRNQGILVVQNVQLDPRRLRGFPIETVSDELELINRIIDIVINLDPDIVLGWEVQAGSWGYLSARGLYYGLDIGELVSRAPGKSAGSGDDQWGARTTTTFKVTGRHVFNVWRIMRSDQTLGMYSFENVAFHLLHRRVPRYTPLTLTEWFNSNNPVHTYRVLQYYCDRTILTLDILQKGETTTKNAEFARVFGVDFYSVISRGSQFKVESFMFRIAKPESFVLLSPSQQDVGKQNAAECMPLIMEPLSAFYNGPLLVLDFQSLYPSIMIAYNYCYSTCLGRIAEFQGRNKFGVTDLELPPGILEKLREHITIAPNGIMYVKPIVRQGLLGRMLAELLDTRVMVKHAMKGVKGDKALSRILDARQLGLKYIANVIYGYTSATYSGRMPAVEIADSIVQSGRETLEKAINVIDANEKWGARVVYGDTDSLFIYLKGKTKEQAFGIGYEIADTITAMNPAPVKLKFEKVYLPCVLMAKKRYVGFKYETPDETSPTFDAKGIETVRRDGVPAQSKMTETCLKILFRTQDLSEVKKYCYRSWSKIMRNKVSIQDFTFAKEVKMGTYSDKVPPPPAVAVAARRMLEDENDEPQYGDRVPYLIVRGNPQTRLVDRAITPEEFLATQHLHIDAAYYILRVLIPPLERIFNLVGADVRAWYDEMPKTVQADQQDPLVLSPKKPKRINSNRFKIDEHFPSSRCLACGGLASDGICEDCCVHPEETIPNLLRRLQKGEKKLLNTHHICASCTSTAFGEPIECMNIDCPWLYERKKAEQKTNFLEGLLTIIEDLDLLESENVDNLERMDTFL
ncbi:DNA/RNA polymerase [Gyrodon lividus]|nr:DNA/RNA polymerase [Gyrodon lividus]